jgi:hypothetical protein
MSDTTDFERAWLEKLSRSLAEHAGESVRRQVMKGSDELSSASSESDVIRWTKDALTRLHALVDADKEKSIILGCACEYPRTILAFIREEYRRTGDIDLVLKRLQNQFESHLRDVLGLSEEMIQDIVRRGWGVAGVREGDTIIATKIPKSENLAEYMKEKNPQKRRELYCHCPRIREILKTTDTLPSTYCYCGAGFYAGIWEEILQEPVEIEILKTVLQGDDVCQVAIHLPPPTAA